MSTPNLPHIIIGVAPIFGHIEKFKVVGAELVKQGYTVTFLTGVAIRDEVEKIGARFAPLTGCADFDFENRNTIYPELASLPDGIERVIWEMRTWFIDPIKDQHESLQRELRHIRQNEGEDRQVIYMENNACGASVPLIFGAPDCLHPKGIIKVGTCTLTLDSIDTPPWGMGLPPYETDEDRARGTAMREQAGFMAAPIQELWEDALRSSGVPVDSLDPVPQFLDGIGRACDLYLQMSIPQLEYPRSDLPEWVRFMGALPTVGRKDKELNLPAWWGEVIDAPSNRKRPIIVVSQGSVHNDPEELILPAIKGLQGLDVTVVVTLVKTAALSPEVLVPSNVRLAQFIPFDILFNHTDVLVSNGGFGTVQQALRHGVPMVLAGKSADKAETNAHAAWAGAAIDLACQKPEPAAVRDAVCGILSDTKRRERCLELKREYEKYDAIEVVTGAIEDLLH
ncbi:4'-demethylrebeccamycin synthase [Cladobotryum mycophilum]|uniref:4'-demethylrebeccamycin synthase n=1 Tax=Cladobotryum mycophilum TaxID=491253 RepID=A0ABR0T4C2_9HYPO